MSKDKLPLPKQEARAKPPLQVKPLNPTPLNQGLAQVMRMFLKATEPKAKSSKT